MRAKKVCVPKIGLSFLALFKISFSPEEFFFLVLGGGRFGGGGGGGAWLGQITPPPRPPPSPWMSTSLREVWRVLSTTNDVGSVTRRDRGYRFSGRHIQGGEKFGRGEKLFGQISKPSLVPNISFNFKDSLCHIVSGGAITTPFFFSL